MATVQIRKEEVGEFKDIKTFFDRLSEKYSGKWVAILDNGEIIGMENLEDVYAEVSKKKIKIATLFQVPKKGQMLLL